MTRGLGEQPSQNNNIEALIAAFEANVAGQASVYLDQSAFLDIIDHYLAHSKVKKAMMACKQALVHFNFSSDFHLRQAQLLARNHQFSKAHRALDRAEIYSPNDEELGLCRAEILIMQGATVKGLDKLSELQKSATLEFLADVYTVESLAHEYQADFKRAFGALKDALYAWPTHDEALERFANCMAISRQYEEAEVVFEMVIDENPYNWAAWYYLGEVLTYLDRVPEALEAYEYAFLINEDFEEAYFEYAELCFVNKLYEKALDAYQEITDRFTSDCLLIQRKGACLQGMGEYEAAQKELQRAARIEPHNDEVVYQIGMAYAAQKKWESAYAVYQKAIRLNGAREDYHSALAQAAYELNRYEEAENAYRYACLLGSGNCDTWLNLAWFLLETNRPEESLHTLMDANQVLIEAELQYSYIALLLLNGRRQQGLQRLSEALAETYHEHSYLFDWSPDLDKDRDVLDLLELYRI